MKTVVPATPADAYGLLVSAIRDDDPVVVFAPAAALGVREDVDYRGSCGRAARRGSGAPRGRRRDGGRGRAPRADALAVADQLADQISVEVFDPRTLYPFDWAGLAASVAKTGRLVVVDDSNRSCGIGAEILATAAEGMRLIAPPRRVTRPDGAVLPFALALDLALQPSHDQLVTAVQEVCKGGR